MDSTDYRTMRTSLEMLDGQHQASCGEMGPTVQDTEQVELFLDR